MSKYSPTLVDGKLDRLSVSQLTRFNHNEHGGCQRKWYYNKIAGLPDGAPSQAILKGLAGHRRLEKYFNNEPVVFEEIDFPALKHLPLPGLGDGHPVPELGLQLLELEGVKFQGSMDLVDGSTVYDHKYQGTIKVYSEPTAQTWGYLEEMRLRHQAQEVFSFKYTFIQMNGAPKAASKTFTFDAGTISNEWQKYGYLVREMQSVASEKEVGKVPVNRNACYAWGRNSPCPYLSICNRGEIKIEGENEMSFLDELTKAKEETKGPAVSIPEIKALPPDAPPADAIPEPKITAPEPGRKPKKKPKESEPVAASIRLKSIEVGLTIGMPEHSSVRAAVTVEGVDEEEMAAEAQKILIRRLEKLIPAYTQAIELRNGAKK